MITIYRRSWGPQFVLARHEASLESSCVRTAYIPWSYEFRQSIKPHSLECYNSIVHFDEFSDLSTTTTSIWWSSVNLSIAVISILISADWVRPVAFWSWEEKSSTCSSRWEDLWETHGKSREGSYKVPVDCLFGRGVRLANFEIFPGGS